MCCFYRTSKIMIMKKLILSIMLAGFFSGGVIMADNGNLPDKCNKKDKTKCERNRDDKGEANNNKVTHNKVTKSKPAQKVGQGASWTEDKAVHNKATKQLKKDDGDDR